MSAPGNNKPLGDFQRAFVVVAENATALIRSFRLTIDNQPAGGTASFLQSAPLPDARGDGAAVLLGGAQRVRDVDGGTRRINVSIVEIIAAPAGRWSRAG